ncbi:hypothetical protein Dsin_029470 [Dipteronia sinensis]|uniref:Uncharacterized protein n=1 Tax=Dipteronia sinensis TaxID=43782 RepID=A0AAE0DVK8_9ROSI|nr:hypothetical protein Dsin_029470 [Dipteronia sinensis]
MYNEFNLSLSDSCELGVSFENESPLLILDFGFLLNVAYYKCKLHCLHVSFSVSFLYFALFLVAIPLFHLRLLVSSAKIWELVHLLFIGVPVSYGLFCRRNVDADKSHTTNDDDDSELYVSRVFRVLIYEDRFDNSCGYGEKNMYQTLYSENYKASESLVDTSTGNSAMGEQKQIGSFNSELGFEYTHVGAQPVCSVSRYSESGLLMDRKSLNLPIRSLSSGDRNLSDGSESNSPSMGSSNSPYVGIDNEFGDMYPTNLENRFDETDSFSPWNWLSRSERMDFGKCGCYCCLSFAFKASID